MHTRTSTSTLAFMGLALVGGVLAACGSPEPPDRIAADPIESPELAVEAPTRSFAGALVEVDLDAQTFTVADGGIDRTFAFDDATEALDTDAVAAGSVQGLTGSEGARVEVRYQERADGPHAVLIAFQ